MLINERAILSNLLRETADALDIPEYIYEDATIKYEDVGEYLGADDSALKLYNPQIYAQGSFRLGTVVQPVDDECGYDIDLVCQLEIAKEQITQKDLKSRVGERLKKRADLKEILESSRRCWVLNYSADQSIPNFHMDVLPSIPNAEHPPSGILLTDTELVRWQKSNPIAYADWFKSRMSEVFERRKIEFAESIKANVEDVPDWRIKTPLQRSVQILKRHRDVYFGENENKPISIILTTLAAHAYEGQDDIYDALTNITKRMSNFIENRGGVWCVQNPVDPDENFADKWNEYPERREAFVQWLANAIADFENISKAGSISDGIQMLNESMGRQTMSSVAASLGVPHCGALPPIVRNIPLVPALADYSHAQRPQWPVTSNYNVKVIGRVYTKKRRGKVGRYLKPLGDSSVPKRVWIKFQAHTDVPPPYSIKWQVVNTGQDAMNNRDPRGDFYDSGEPNVRWESTAYKGTHWVEAFIIKNGLCVGRSGQILVKVR